MAMAKIKTDEERARLDQIFAEIEAVERGEPIPTAPTAKNTVEESEARKAANEKRIAGMDLKMLIGNVRTMQKDGAFRTKWERILSQVVVETYAPMATEINILRNFASAVSKRLEAAERSAKEQDNHHYYKIFAEQTRQLLEKL